MRDFIGFLIIIAVVVLTLFISKVIFDAIINSDLPLFWKWALLRG